MRAQESAYQGASGRTRRERRSYACRCGERFEVELLRAVDARADTEVAAQLLAGQANRARCPRCGTIDSVAVSVVYHDPAAPLLALVLPDALRHRELAERGRLYLRLAEDRAAAPAYVRELRVVFGLDELRALVAPAETVAPEAGHPGSVAEADETDDATRALSPNPDPRAAAIDRFVQSGEPATTLLCESDVLHLALLPESEAAPFVDGPLELRVQLHRMPTYPVLSLTLLAPANDDRPRALHALLEIGRAADRAVLERVAQRASLTVELFTPEYLPLGRHVVSAPLEPNVLRLFDAAREALKRIEAPRRDFDAARLAFLAPDYDRLGRVEPDFTAARSQLDRPQTVRRAVAEVARWSEPGAEAYLIEIRSFPLATWSELRVAVVRRAIELGLHARRSLVERVLAEAKLSASWPDVLRRQLKAFAALFSGRPRPAINDLSTEEEAENWRLLLSECDTAGVEVDPEVHALASAWLDEASPLADGMAAEPPTFDAARATITELIALLDRRELRRDVALALCERRDIAGMAPVFHALPKMTRVEVNRVLPALVAVFGDAAVPLLVDGLRSRKSYVRQGSALGLGALGAASAVEPLVALLAQEPTEVWREVARAVGDLGAVATDAIAARLRRAGAETRERLVRALAHVAGRGAREAVERLAGQGDPMLRDAASRAIALYDEIRQADREVRVEAPHDETMVRAFSRRFFEALGEDAELAELDLEELAEGAAKTGSPLPAGDGEDAEDAGEPLDLSADAEDDGEPVDDGEPLDDDDLVEELPAPPPVLAAVAPAAAHPPPAETTEPRTSLPGDRST